MWPWKYRKFAQLNWNRQVTPSGILSTDKLLISGLILRSEFQREIAFALKHEAVNITTNILPKRGTTEREWSRWPNRVPLSKTFPCRFWGRNLFVTADFGIVKSASTMRPSQWSVCNNLFVPQFFQSSFGGENGVNKSVHRAAFLLMQCIFIVNNNIQKKKKEKRKRWVSQREQKVWGRETNKTQTQTKPYLRAKYDLNARFLKLQKYFF